METFFMKGMIRTLILIKGNIEAEVLAEAFRIASIQDFNLLWLIPKWRQGRERALTTMKLISDNYEFVQYSAGGAARLTGFFL